MDNSGPAFPCGHDVTQGQVAPHGGMSLRDWFAGMAMHGYLAATEIESSWPKDAELAKWSYDAADAMLAAREKP